MTEERIEEMLRIYHACKENRRIIGDNSMALIQTATSKNQLRYLGLVLENSKTCYLCFDYWYFPYNDNSEYMADLVHLRFYRQILVLLFATSRPAQAVLKHPVDSRQPLTSPSRQGETTLSPFLSNASNKRSRLLPICKNGTRHHCNGREMECYRSWSLSDVNDESTFKNHMWLIYCYNLFYNLLFLVFDTSFCIRLLLGLERTVERGRIELDTGKYILVIAAS